MHRAIFVASVTFAFAMAGLLVADKVVSNPGNQTDIGPMTVYKSFPLTGGAIGFAVAVVALWLYPPKK